VGKFNPLIADTQYDEYVNGLVYASMLRLDAKIELEPAVAEKYEAIKDSTVITFTLPIVQRHTAPALPATPPTPLLTSTMYKTGR